MTYEFEVRQLVFLALHSLNSSALAQAPFQTPDLVSPIAPSLYSRHVELCTGSGCVLFSAPFCHLRTVQRGRRGNPVTSSSHPSKWRSKASPSENCNLFLTVLSSLSCLPTPGACFILHLTCSCSLSLYLVMTSMTWAASFSSFILRISTSNPMVATLLSLIRSLMIPFSFCYDILLRATKLIPAMFFYWYR